MTTALFSVHDKHNLTMLGSGLQELGWQLLASGGSSRELRQAGLKVEEVSSFTGSPEILGGRVKTLHPKIHAGILARDSEEDNEDLRKVDARRIDMVVVNLYPFQETVARPRTTMEEAIEQIDIGGVALLRAAAKNYRHVIVLCDPVDYPDVLGKIRSTSQISILDRKKLAAKVFHLTSRYDQAIARYFDIDTTEGAADKSVALLDGVSFQQLRYGENPHQQGRFYQLSTKKGPLGGELLQGKPLSYTNILDLDAVWRAVVAFEEPTACIVKHLSPCGLATDSNIAKAFVLALASDPVSAFGGVLAFNRVCDAELAASIGDLFVECLIAPGFTDGGLTVLSKRKNCRLLAMGKPECWPPYEIRSVNHGILWQTLDHRDPDDTRYRIVTVKTVDTAQLESLKFAMQVCQHVKSNAIVVCQDKATVGIGGGQPNRVDSVRIALRRAGERARNAVMASDAFFPFPDWADEAAKAGISAVIQPGGSVRDEESIKAANHYGMAMVFTGMRHFRH